MLRKPYPKEAFNRDDTLLFRELVEKRRREAMKENL